MEHNTTFGRDAFAALFGSDRVPVLLGHDGIDDLVVLASEDDYPVEPYAFLPRDADDQLRFHSVALDNACIAAWRSVGVEPTAVIAKPEDGYASRGGEVGEGWDDRIFNLYLLFRLHGAERGEGAEFGEPIPAPGWRGSKLIFTSDAVYKFHELKAALARAGH